MQNIFDVMKYGTLGRNFPGYRKACDFTYTTVGIIGTGLILGYVIFKASEKITDFIINKIK